MMGFALSALGIAKRIPWWAYAALALLAVWWIDRTTYGNARDAEARAEMQFKIDTAEKQRQSALRSEEIALRNLAKRTTRNVIASREAVRPAVDDFIRRGGVRTEAAADNQPQGGSAGSGEAMRPSSELASGEPVQTVAVYAEDVRICTANTLLAEELRAFVLALESSK